MRPGDQRFVGEICGFGTTSGWRIVIGRWPVSPFGPFTDAMVEGIDGKRWLLAPREDVAAYVAGIYEFDEVVATPVSAERSTAGLRVAGGPLVADVVVGRRDRLGWVLRSLPHRVATSTAWAAVVDPVARMTMPGVRTRGRTAGGEEFYGATDRHRLARITARWEGSDLGSLADVVPPVRFGFSSAPRRPSIVAVTTTVRRR